MPRTALVCVVMPRRNGADYIVHARDAIFAQTWGGDLELIVVDDASDDPGTRYVRCFADDRVRLFAFDFPDGQPRARAGAAGPETDEPAPLVRARSVSRRKTLTGLLTSL